MLAELGPDLRQALRIAALKAYVIPDGTLVTTDRLSGENDRLYYSGKHRRHGVNVQFLTDPHGEMIWASPALPGSTHDLTARRARRRNAQDLAHPSKGPLLTQPHDRRSPKDPHPRIPGPMRMESSQ